MPERSIRSNRKNTSSTDLIVKVTNAQLEVIWAVHKWGALGQLSIEQSRPIKANQA
jgi:hypothetical protein